MPLGFWCRLVRRMCGLWLWVVVTVLSRRDGLGVKGSRLWGAVRVRLVIRLRLGLGGCGGLGGFDGCGLVLGAVGRSGARWRAR